MPFKAVAVHGGPYGNGIAATFINGIAMFEMWEGGKVESLSLMKKKESKHYINSTDTF